MTVGGDGGSGAEATLVVGDTVVTPTGPYLVPATASNTTFVVTVVVNSSVVPLSNASTATLQLRLDGAATWVDVTAGATIGAATTAALSADSGALTVETTVAGRHTAEVRCVSPVFGADPTSWTQVWYVDALPVVTIVSAPDAVGAVPSDGATIVVAPSAPWPLTTYQYKLYGSNSSSTDVARATWLHSDRAVFTFTGLTPGDEYVFTVRAVSANGLLVRVRVDLARQCVLAPACERDCA